MDIRSSLWYVAEVALAIVIGLLVGAAIMQIGGYDPWAAYYSLFAMTLSSPYMVCSAISFMSPLVLTALTFAIGVRAGVFNIGAEGQVYIGALGAVVVGAFSLPPYLYLPLEVALALSLATLWGTIAGVLKAYRGVNEVVSTIMLNWIAYWIVEYMRVHVIFDPRDASKTIPVPPQGRLPLLVQGTELSAELIIALVVDFVMLFLLWYTVLGYEIRAVGLNPQASKYGGINVKRAVVYSFLLGGIASGLAGFGEVAGRPPSYAITTGLSNLFGLGFDGLAVSLIGANHPLGILPAAFLMGIMKAGSRNMQIYARVPLEMVQIVQGVIVVALSVPGILRLIRRRLGR
ncbi:MAG: ABC transporter permease [Desulfurococcaceae archaeon]